MFKKQLAYANMEIFADKNGRVDKLLADALPQYSRAALHKLFAMDLVKLDTMLVKPGHKVHEGAVIEVDLSPLEQEPQVVELPILYEDNSVLVINKPAGIISHARGRYWYEPSVASFVRFHLFNSPIALSKEPYAERAGIVHRLDRATSGVMICAKNESATKYLQKQFADRKVAKTYIALVKGQMNDNEAVIDAPIERNTKKPTTFQVGPSGKSAETHYKVLDVSKRLINGKKMDTSMLELSPKTGRTHQLRVHAASIGHPIIGDPVYGEGKGPMRLHARSLALPYDEVAPLTVTAPLPRDWPSQALFSPANSVNLP